MATDKKIKAQSGQDLILGDTLVVDSTGNVGIGTSSPSDKLHLLGTGSTGIRIDDSGTARYAEVTFGTTNSAMVIGSQGGVPYPIEFQMNTTEVGSISSSGAWTLGPTGAIYNGTNPIHNVCGNLWFGTVTGTAYSGEFAIGVNARVSPSTGMAGRTNASTTGTAIYIANVSSNTSVDAFTIRTNNATDLTDAVAKTIMSATAAGAWTLGPNGFSETHKINGITSTGTEAGGRTYTASFLRSLPEGTATTVFNVEVANANNSFGVVEVDIVASEATSPYFGTRSIKATFNFRRFNSSIAFSAVDVVSLNQQENSNWIVALAVTPVAITSTTFEIRVTATDTGALSWTNAEAAISCKILTVNSLTLSVNNV